MTTKRIISDIYCVTFVWKKNREIRITIEDWFDYISKVKLVEGNLVTNLRNLVVLLRLINFEKKKKRAYKTKKRKCFLLVEARSQIEKLSNSEEDPQVLSKRGNTNFKMIVTKANHAVSNKEWW